MLIDNLKEMKSYINKILFKYVHRQWNIAIAEYDSDLNPVNIKWMKHNYKDRWFADPFIIDETVNTFIILAEEYMRDDRKARLAKLIVTKDDCKLIDNETVLNLDTHLSFPNFIDVDGSIYVYPENGRSGKTNYYELGEPLKYVGELSSLPLADAAIQVIENRYYLLFTLGEECNGNRLMIYVSDTPLGSYKPLQEVLFSDNIARRAGRLFKIGNRLISPAQVCNNRYGEGVCLQEVNLVGDKLTFKEVKRLYPTSKEYPYGLHTYNVFGSHVVIDGYRFKCPFLSRLYFKLRNGKL